MNSLSSSTQNRALTSNFHRLGFAASNTIGKFVQKMILRHQYNQTVAALSLLNDHELDDIGLVRANIKEAVKSSLR